MTLILGVGFSTHDLSCCAIVDGRIEVAIARERLTRIKHDGGWADRIFDGTSWDPSVCIDYCLGAIGAGIDDVDRVIENHVLSPPVDRFHADVVSKFATPYPAGKSVMIPHHLAHAYSTYCASGFQDAAVIVVDGIGNSYEAVNSYAGEDGEFVRNTGKSKRSGSETLSVYSVSGGKFEVVRKDFGFRSLGFAYRTVTARIFGRLRDAGKTMGLAPYGRPGSCGIPLVRSCDGVLSYDYDDSLRNIELPPPIHTWPDDQESWGSDRQLMADLAWKMQDDLEKALVDLARWVKRTTGQERLCLAGGVALNSVANKKILDAAGFREIFIVPAAGDDGISVGCAYWGHCQEGFRASAVAPLPIRSGAFGRCHPKTSVDAAVSSDRRLVVGEHDSATMIERAVDALAAGKIIGWFDGKSELGPRALGHRSILASPLDPGMKAVLNARVKFREAFRPFAPTVLEEHAAEYFDLAVPSPFMLLVANVRQETKDRIPAVTHVDGTARVQTVNARDDGAFYQLVRAFGDRTGVPVLLNTSFNVRGEPIVETPIEAVNCLLATDCDALAIDGYWVTKRTLADDELLDAVVLPNAHAALELTYLAHGASMAPTKAVWRSRFNHEHSSAVPLWLAAMVTRMDGTRSLRQLMNEDGTGIDCGRMLVDIRAALDRNLVRTPT